MSIPFLPPLVVILGLGLLLCWAGGVVAVWRVLTRPPRRTYASAVARGRAGDPGELVPARRFESWTLETRGLRLPVWDVVGDDPAGVVVVMSHGWGDSRVGALQRLGLLARSARRVVMWDMAGHGEAPGSSSLGTREVEDLVALVERVADAEPSGVRGRVVLYGWSLGAGVSIAAGATEVGRGLVSGVIAEAPYRLAATPARNMMRAMRWPVVGGLGAALRVVSSGVGGGLEHSRFDRARLAGGLACPLLVLHGEEDEICPVADGREIAAARGAVVEARVGVDGQAERAVGASGFGVSGLVVFAGAGHNDLWQNERRLACGEAAVRVFLSSLGVGLS